MKRIAICAITFWFFDGRSIDKGSLGGSESAAISIARELVKLGYSVTVFTILGQNETGPGVYDGVIYESIYDIDSHEPFDVFISSKMTIPFLPDGYLADTIKWTVPKIERVSQASTYKILWLHDMGGPGQNFIEDVLRENRVDKIFVLSDYHKHHISNYNNKHCGVIHDLPIERDEKFMEPFIHKTRNGINLYDVPVEKEEKTFIFTSAPDKGLFPLLDWVWPGIREKYKDAKLLIVGEPYKMVKHIKASDIDKASQRFLEHKANLDGKEGITFVGSVSQHEVARLLGKSQFMLYPCDWPETYGIAVSESIAYGTPVITCNFGALTEVALDDCCYKIDGPVHTREQANVFIQNAISAIEDNDQYDIKVRNCMNKRAALQWSEVAKEWDEFFKDVIPD